MTLFLDRPTSAKRLVTRQNVISGSWTESESSVRSRHTKALLTYNDKTNGWQRAILPVLAAPEVIARYDTLVAKEELWGCTSEGQATRYGKWLLYSEANQLASAKWQMEREALNFRVWDVVKVMDKGYSGRDLAGRVVSVTGTTVVLDRPITLNAGASSIDIATDDGSFETANIVQTNGTFSTLTLSAALTKTPNAKAVFQILTGIEPRYFRIQKIAQNEKLWDIEAVQYDPNKWAAVELGIVAQPKTFIDFDISQIAAPTDIGCWENTSWAGNVASRNLHIEWKKPALGAVTGYVLKWRDSRGTWVTESFLDEPQFDIRNVTAGTFEIEVYALGLGLSGSTLRSSALTTTYTIDFSVSTGSLLSSPVNLTTQSGNTTFDGPSLSIRWNNNPANTASPIPLMDYQVQIKNASTGAVIRTVNVPDVANAGSYTYTFDQNQVDNGGTAARSVMVSVSARDTSFKVTNPITVTFTNAAPAAVNGFAATTQIQAVTLTWNRNTDADFAGYLVWRGDTAAFTPSAANLIQDTQSFVVSVDQAENTTKYFRIAAYDTFGNPANGSGLNVSGAIAGLAAKVPGIASGATFPASPAAGDFFTLTTTNALYQYTGGKWVRQGIQTGTSAQMATAASTAIAGDQFSNTQDGFLYTFTSGAWTKTIPTIPAVNISGTITAAQIAAQTIDQTKLASNLSAITTVTTLPTSYVTPSVYMAGKVYDWNGTAYSRTIEAAQIAANSIDASKFSTDLAIIKTVTAVPTSYVSAVIYNSTDGLQYTWKNGAYSKTVATVDLVGQVVASQIASNSVDISKFATNITPVITATSQPGSTYLGATQVWFNGQTYTWDNGKYSRAVATIDLVGTINSAQVADNAIGLTKFASGLAPFVLASTNPEGTTTYLGSSLVYWGGYLFRWAGSGVYTKAVPSSDITGTLADAQVASLAASKITGQLTDAQLSSVSAAKVSGTLTSAQIASLDAAKIAGQLTNAQVASIATTKLTGTLTDAQIAQVSAAKIAGQLSDSQLATISAAKVSGTLTSAQIASLDAAKVAGQLTSAQIASLDAAKVAGQLSDSQLSSISAAKIAGQLVDSQLSALSAGKISGQLTDAQISAISSLKLVGQITGTQIQDGSISTGKLVANSVTTDVLAANSVTGKQLAIGDFSNFVINGNGESTAGWTGTLSSDFDSNGWPTWWNPLGESGNFSLTIKGRDTYYGARFPVKQGDQFYAKFLSVPTGGGYGKANASLGLRVDDAGGNVIAWLGIAGRGTDKYGGYKATGSTAIPYAGSAFATVWFQIDTSPELAATTGYAMHTANHELRRKNTGELIVDGSISTNLLAAQAVTADKILARSITATQIAAGTIGANEIAGRTITGDRIAAGTLSAYEIAAGSVTADRLVARTITAAQIAAGTIGATEIAARTITGDRIAAGTLSAYEIAAGSVTADRIVGKSLTASQIAAGAITVNELAANSVTAAKILARSISADRIAAGALTAYEIAARTITANNIVTGTISANELAANSVTADKILARTISADRIAVGTIGATELAAGSVIADKIGALQITAAKLAAGAVTAASIATGAIQAGAIAAGAVTAGTLAANSVQAGNIAANAITAASIQAGVISAREIAAGAITSEQMAVVRSGANLLSNPGFEEGFVGWKDKHNQSVNPVLNVYKNQAVGAYEGSAYLSLYRSVPGDRLCVVSKAFPVQPSSTYLVRYRYRCSGNVARMIAYAGGAGNGGVSPDGYLGYPDSPYWDQLPNGAVNVPNDNIWRTYEEVITTRSDVKWQSLAIHHWSDLGTGNSVLEIDDCTWQLQIASAFIGDGAITTPKLIAGAITADKLAVNSVSTDALQANTVNASKLTADSVVAGKVAANAINTRELAAGAITADKLKVASYSTALNSDPNFMDSTAWAKDANWSLGDFVLPGDSPSGQGVLFANGQPARGVSRNFPLDPNKTYRFSCWYRSFSGSNGQGYLRVHRCGASGEIAYYSGFEGAQPNNDGMWRKFEWVFQPEGGSNYGFIDYHANWGGNTGAWQFADLRLEEQVGSTLIQNGSISTDKLVAGSVVAGKIAADAVTTANIQAGAITADHLAVNSVSAGAIQAGVITGDKIAAGAITTEKLSVASQSENLILNGSFEDGMSQWSVGASNVPSQAYTMDSSATGSNQGVYEGKMIARLSRNNASEAIQIVSRAVPVIPGDQYTVRFAYRSLNGRQIGFHMAVGVSPTLPPGGYGTTDAVNAAGGTWYGLNPAMNGVVVTNTAWAIYEYTFTVPYGMYWISFGPHNWSFPGVWEGDCHLDLDAFTLRHVVTSAFIADGAITTNKLVAGAVVAGKVSADAITAGTIAAAAVNTRELAVGAVTADTIAARAISANKLALTPDLNDFINDGGESVTGWTSGAISQDVVNDQGWYDSWWKPLGVNSKAALRCASRDATYGNRFRIRVGDAFHAELPSVPTQGGASKANFNIGLQLFNANGQVVGWVPIAGRPAGYYGGYVAKGDWVCDNVDAYEAIIWMQIDSAAGDAGRTDGYSCYFTRPVMRKKTDASLLVDGSIQASKITGGTITGDKIAANTISAGNIAANSITGDRIAGNTITAGNIVGGSITGDRIAGSTIVGGHIAASTISGGNIAGGTITASNIAGRTIVAGNIVSGTIGANEIAANSITADRMSVGSLQAVTGNMGTLTAGRLYSPDGKFVIDLDNKFISITL